MIGLSTLAWNLWSTLLQVRLLIAEKAGDDAGVVVQSAGSEACTWNLAGWCNATQLAPVRESLRHWTREAGDVRVELVP